MILCAAGPGTQVLLAGTVLKISKACPGIWRGAYHARVALFSATVLWVRATRDIPMADDFIHEFDGYVLGDGEMVSLYDSDKLLAIMRERWSDKKKIFNQLGRFVLECSNRGKDVFAHAYIAFGDGSH